ncbi:hypothetical protein CB0940_00195 [Cercospora beticola]|uniref:Uncharacterized protein n=1 Tax=Cercospora beticola TaxID=122368 RepID=A0A2G5ICZ1_CERBT|nr:hypothetical protein CB0940_00195 [Cercospora beticola]PIB02620.1 hypothetical protein CB0940_00195 [Cercospora beticola]WPA95598.1 hypothetical protein RHO25_000200 [Cercospora beticola]CAK1356166.1 unnamed protein product [Cercospora beticola]
MAHIKTETTTQHDLTEAKFVLTIYHRRLRHTQSKLADLYDLNEEQTEALKSSGITPFTLAHAISLRASLDAAKYQVIFDEANLCYQKRRVATLQARAARCWVQLEEESDEEDEFHFGEEGDFAVSSGAWGLLYGGVKTLGQFFWK